MPVYYARSTKREGEAENGPVPLSRERFAALDRGVPSGARVKPYWRSATERSFAILENPVKAGYARIRPIRCSRSVCLGFSFEGRAGDTRQTASVGGPPLGKSL